jgi:hypothetical protein
MQIEASRLVCANMFMCPCHGLMTHASRPTGVSPYISRFLSHAFLWASMDHCQVDPPTLQPHWRVLWHCMAVGTGPNYFCTAKIDRLTRCQPSDEWTLASPATRAWYTSHLFVLLRTCEFRDRILQEKFVRLSTYEYDHLSRGKVKLITQR